MKKSAECLEIVKAYEEGIKQQWERKVLPAGVAMMLSKKKTLNKRYKTAKMTPTYKGMTEIKDREKILTSETLVYRIN